MGGWNERRVFRQRKIQEKETERRTHLKEDALKDLQGARPTSLEEEAPLPAVRKLPLLEQLKQENEENRRQRLIENEEIDKRKTEKLQQRKTWSKKFQQRTRKGQIPLDHRINYSLKKIKQMKREEM
ncbi:hypothetical protein NEDG_01998 [Nematocida displodere]|uniref:rRNA-processing protein FYV7 n=1 Tax=Nematocida displodere TaxID=1805483 RepID=A0A177EFG4_9MICR|nr:hypothetical protein NEDG_01998 [Nematocida displodere]